MDAHAKQSTLILYDAEGVRVAEFCGPLFGAILNRVKSAVAKNGVLKLLDCVDVVTECAVLRLPPDVFLFVCRGADAPDNAKARFQGDSQSSNVLDDRREPVVFTSVPADFRLRKLMAYYTGNMVPLTTSDITWVRCESETDARSQACENARGVNGFVYRTDRSLQSVIISTNQE